MDNNYGNNPGAQPQRPFTERPEERNNNQQFEFNPEKPLMQNQQNRSAQSDDQGFNPIEQTATYQDGAFNQPVQNPQQGTPYRDYQPGQPQNAQYTDYSRPVYYNGSYAQNGAQGNPQFNGRPAQQPVNTQQPPSQPPFVNPFQDMPSQQPPVSDNPYMMDSSRTSGAHSGGYYRAPKKDKPKGNKGLIAVIIILAVLLAVTFAGILIYAFSNAGTHNNGGGNGSSNSNSFQIPSIENPQQEQQATEAPVFKQSDYSDKTQKDYKGLETVPKPVDAATNKSYGAEHAFQKASPAVVGIKGFSDKDKKVKSSEGSGIVISEDGYVITNSHVIGNSKTAMLLSVYTSDGKEYNAGVVGFDARTDIALLKLDDAKGLTPAVFGDSEKLEQGEDIIVVGNPGGLDFQNSMTKGIISALERDASKKSIVKYIQTDAAINPGNSGGPAVNLYGQVIGMATAKIVDESYEGMGFCIPSKTIKSITDSLMKQGYVENRVKIGISGVALTSAEAAQYGVAGGILVDTVQSDGPCGKAGISKNDIIYEADGKSIKSFSDIFNVLEEHKSGDKIKIKYYKYKNGSNGFSGTYSEEEAEIELVEDKG